MPWLVYKAIFLSKSRDVTQAIKIWSYYCDLYAHVQPISLLCCRFQIIILQTVGEVAETLTQQWYVYTTNFLSTSRVCNSKNNNFTRVLWPLCTCSVNVLTKVQVSNYELENCRSCEDGHKDWQTYGWTHRCMTVGKTIYVYPPPLHGRGITRALSGTMRSAY